MLRIVSGSRHSSADFPIFSALARSTNELRNRGGVMLHVFTGSNASLPVVFNSVIEQAAVEDLVVFTHDDVWIDDWFLPERLAEGLNAFGVLGVAGNRRRVPGQIAWAFPAKPGVWDEREHLSGAVAHGIDRYSPITSYGPTPREVKLIDGVFIAARVGTLRSKGVAFDPQFCHHFYDLDFCRSCEKAGVSIGTWPIAITHGSGGNFGTPEWQEASRLYLAKWGE